MKETGKKTMSIPALDNAEFPRMYPVRQFLHRTGITDMEAAVKQCLAGISVDAGQKIGICVGSRGVPHIAMIVRLLAEHLKAHGARPVLIPAMGSHGGAEAEGQVSLLAEYGITPEAMGVRFESSMAVSDLGTTPDGYRVYMDQAALGCDRLIAINRIKAHTDFYGETESGILKMLAIGLGNHAGASYIHGFGVQGLSRAIPAIAGHMLTIKPISGIGILEDGYGEIAHLEMMHGREIPEAEKACLIQANQWKAKIPFQKLDCLVVGEMGKNISGAGMDTKIIGRIRFPEVEEPASPAPNIVVCLRLTPQSHGNAAGVGLADLIPQKLYEAIDSHVTFINGITARCPARYSLPMHLPDDRTTLLAGISFSRIYQDSADRVAWIRNTRDLERIYVSEALLKEAIHKGLAVLDPHGTEIRFEADNDVTDLCWSSA